MAYTQEQLEFFKKNLPELFHRTFMSDHTELENARKIFDETGGFSGKFDGGRSPNQSPSMSSVDSTARKFSRAAFYTDGSALFPTRIWAREGQNLDAYATPWERWWSQLFSNRSEAFTPIVDMYDTLVGHSGRVRSELILGKYAPEGSRDSFSNAYWNYDLLVGNGDAEKASGYRSVLYSFSFYTVQTGTEGNVVSGAYSGRTNNGEVTSPDIDPLDLLAAGKILFSLGTVITKVGVRAIRSVERKIVARQVAKKEVRSAANTLKGMAVTTSGEIPNILHGGRRTIIMGEDTAFWRDAMAKVHVEHGFYDVVLHGDPHTFGVVVKYGGKTVYRQVSAREVANIIRPQLAAGEQIRLISCKVGRNGEGPAKELATLLNRTVWGSTEEVLSEQIIYGTHKVFAPTNNGRFIEFLP